MSWFEKKQKTRSVDSVSAVKKTDTKTSKTVYNPAVLKRVWITEKSTDLGSLRKYVFLTDKNANAAEIKKAVEGIYNVSVDKANIVNFARRKRFRGRASKTEQYKKAIVTLAKGEELDVIPK